MQTDTPDHVAADRASMPGIIYGTAWKKHDTERLVATALQAGFRGIDTACQPKHYNEAGVGAGLAAALGRGLAREAVFVQTKFTSVSGQDPARIPYDANAAPAVQVEQSFAVSLKNLRTDYIDSLVMHSPEPSLQQTLKVWRAMEALVDRGNVRQLGISNCYDLDLLTALHGDARIKPVVVQNRFYADSGYDRGVRAFCRSHGLTYQSFWTLSANPEVLNDQVVTTAAATRGRTAAQILFRFLSQQGVVPLTGTRSDTHMREDLQIFEFELTDAECGAIDALLYPRLGQP